MQFQLYYFLTTFLLILTTLYLNNTKVARDELVTNDLTAQFQDIYVLEEKLTTDKSLCPFSVCVCVCIYIYKEWKKNCEAESINVYSL